MGTATNFIPMTLKAPATPGSCVIVIDSGANRRAYGPNPPTPNALWFTVYDRKTLAKVYDVSQTNADTVPSGLSDYLNSNYILAVVSNLLGTDNVPQGNLYAMLNANGAGSQLARLEQINLQLSCGELGHVAYVLLTVPGTGNPGFEESALNTVQGAIMTAQLLPTVLPDKSTIYTPVEVE